MIALLLVACLWMALSAPQGMAWPAPGATVRGHALYWNAGKFAQVARVRHMTLRTDVYGYAAVPDCRWIGSVIEASIKGGPFRRYQVLDCAQPYHFKAQVNSGQVIEVNWAVAQEYGFTKQGRAPAVVRYPGGKP